MGKILFVLMTENRYPSLMPMGIPGHGLTFIMHTHTGILIYFVVSCCFQQGLCGLQELQSSSPQSHFEFSSGCVRLSQYIKHPSCSESRCQDSESEFRRSQSLQQFSLLFATSNIPNLTSPFFLESQYLPPRSSCHLDSCSS